MPTWGIVLIVLGSVFGTILLLALLAIPTFLAEQEPEEEAAAEGSAAAETRAQDDFDAIRYSLPDEVAGIPRMDVAAEAAMIEDWGLDALPTFLANPQIGVYGTEDEPLIVSTGEFRAAANEVEQATVRRNYLADWTAEGEPLELAELDAGALGGYFGCAQDPYGHVCVSTDSRGLLEIWSSRSDANPEAIATTIRQSVVTRDGATGATEETT